MTILKESFMEAWKRNFGEFPPPGLMFLQEASMPAVISGGKRHLSDLELLEDDFKLCKSRIFKLRSEIRREKFCQAWIVREIAKQRRSSEGLESVGSDDANSNIDLESESGLKSGESDAEVVDDELEDGGEEMGPRPGTGDSPIIPARPARMSKIAKKTPVPTLTRFVKLRDPDADEDNDSGDSDSSDEYENVAFLLKHSDHTNRDSVMGVSPRGSPVDSRGSDVDDLAEGEGIRRRVGSFGSSIDERDITTDRRLAIIANRSTMYESGPSSPQVDSPAPFSECEQGYESSSTTEDFAAQSPLAGVRQDSGALSADSVSLTASVDSVEEKDAPSETGPRRPNDITLVDGLTNNSGTDQDGSVHGSGAPVRCGSLKLSSPEVESLSIRRLLLKGILESEKKYLKSLEELQKVMRVFKASTGTSSPVLTEEEYDTMFFRIPDLCAVHRQFVNHMQPKLDHWTPEEMQGDSFKLLASHFDMHEEYISNYRKAMSTLQRLQAENELFNQISQQALKLETGEVYTLEAMLYSPLQGITKLTMTLNDLLKHTPEHHEDHSIFSHVLEKTRKFFKQVDEATREIHSTKQKRELLRQGYLVEWTEGRRKVRRVLLWSDLIICASKRQVSGMFQRDRGQYDFQWYVPLTELSLTPNERCEAEPRVVNKSDMELTQMKKEISELQESIKRDKAAKPSKSIQKSIESKRKRIAELEVTYVLESPKLPFHLYHHSGKTYTMLMSSDYERSDWKEAILTAKRECRLTPSITPYHISKLIPKARRGRGSANNISSVLLKDSDELLTGTLHVMVKEARGLSVPSQLYCCIETDAYGIFCLMAKTRRTANTITPKWNEEFALDVDGARNLRILCYDFTKGLDDEMYDKGAISLKKEALGLEAKNFTVFMDQLQVDISIRFESSEKTLKRVQSRRKMGVFGVQVGTLASRQGKSIPNIITMCLEEVERRGIHEMGIYRISGSSADIQKLKKGFEQNRRNIASMLKQSDIHAVAGLFKSYLRELPEPLFTHALYPQLVDGLQLTDPEAKKKCFLSLMKKIPEPNKTIIFLLFNHLRRIAKEEESNKMSIHNLSTVFGPTLLGPATMPSTGKPDILAEIMGMSSVVHQVGILHYCLEHFTEATVEQQPDAVTETDL